MIAKSKHARATMISDRLDRKAKTRLRELESDCTTYRRVAQLAQERATRAERDRDRAIQRVSDAIPIYCLAQKNERRYDEYTYVITFRPRAFAHAMFRDRHDAMLNISDEVRRVAEDAGHKIAHTILTEINQSFQPFGSPYGR